jgi:uncharacterized membrane protein
MRTAQSRWYAAPARARSLALQVTLALPFLASGTPGDAQANAVDADGNTVVGYGTPGPNSNQDHVVSWTANLWGANDLGTLPASTAPTGAAHGISSDGTVIVGRSGEGEIASHQAFRWSLQSGYTLLGYADGGEGDPSLHYSAALAISGNGLVIAGAASDPTGEPLPVLWTQAGEVHALGTLPSGGSGQGQATAASSDGSVLVGSVEGPSGEEAFRWTAESMVGLGDLPGGNSSTAYDVSGDGLRVVGSGSSAANPTTGEAFFWDEAGGMRTLKETMQEHGFEDPLTDWTLQFAYAISSDGKVIVGCGLNAAGSLGQLQAFRVRLEPEP